MAGIVNGVSVGVAFLNRGFVNLTGRHFSFIDGLKRNVLQMMHTCSRICSFMCNAGGGLGSSMGVTGLITTSLCIGRGLSGIFVNLTSNNDYSIYNRSSCVNPYNDSCSSCHSMQLFFGMGNLIIFNSIILKKIYQCCKRYILRAGIVHPIQKEDIRLLCASGVGIMALGISLLDPIGRSEVNREIERKIMFSMMYSSIGLYFIFVLFRLEELHEE